jgi:AraC-like DNA-binding protein
MNIGFPGIIRVGFTIHTPFCPIDDSYGPDHRFTSPGLVLTRYLHQVIPQKISFSQLNSNIHIPASPHLKDMIHAIWQTSGHTRFLNEQILPSGIIEVIFNFSEGSPMLATLGNRTYHLSRCFINGFNTVPVKIQLPEQQVFFGVQLQPLAVRKILGVPANKFSDTIVDLALIDSVFQSLWHQLADQTHFENRISVFYSWIENKIPGWYPQEKMINHFLSGTNRHDVSVTELALSLCYSTRQLSRKMAEATGMNTEEILRYKKYLHSMDLIHHTNLPLTKISYQSHFSDQSHFIKSFKTYTGMTPGEYKVAKGYVKGHLYENVR